MLNLTYSILDYYNVKSVKSLNDLTINQKLKEIKPENINNSLNAIRTTPQPKNDSHKSTPNQSNSSSKPDIDENSKPTTDKPKPKYNTSPPSIKKPQQLQQQSTIFTCSYYIAVVYQPANVQQNSARKYQETVLILASQAWMTFLMVRYTIYSSDQKLEVEFSLCDGRNIQGIEQKNDNQFVNPQKLSQISDSN
ncbi:MAG: hypothetical protein EZS28_019684 [Streblomastix strix]|uniref:Uncharacterized protein n=1 Tax=Streblomastix strix TaxID=222440 RepID=A0A5J4VQN6_9EUKA|nr:MAG: hypothetical protein EZS28_019684 [Streblomastix strix]